MVRFHGLKWLLILVFTLAGSTAVRGDRDHSILSRLGDGGHGSDEDDDDGPSEDCPDQIRFVADPVDSPDPFSPPGQHSTLSCALRVRAMPGFRLDPRSPFRYVARVTWMVKPAAGSSIEIVREKLIPRPSLRARDRHHTIPIELALDWDGTRPGGQEVASGTHAYRVRAQLVRIKSGRHTREKVLDETESFRGTLTIQRPLTPPTIAITSPADGFLTSQATAMIAGTVAGSPPLTVTVNGDSVTFVQPGFTKTLALVEGPNVVMARVTDGRGQTAEAVITVRRDSVSPSLTLMPAHGARVNTGTPVLLGTYADPDPGTSIDVSTVSATLDGQDVTSELQVDPVQARYVVPQSSVLTDGPHTFSMRARDGAGNETFRTSTFEVDVPEPPTVALIADPPVVVEGQSTTLTWQSTNASSATMTPGESPVSLSGSQVVFPTQTTTYRITVVGPDGTASSEVTVEVISTRPTAALIASPAEVDAGAQTTLTWTTVGAVQAFLEPGIGEVPLAGSRIVSPAHSTEYRLTVVGPTGVNSARIRVQVKGSPFPPPEGTFGHPYRDLIPRDATIAGYDKDRFSILTGRVQDIEGNPLPAVTIRVEGHPEYGTATTSSDGSYALPVDGGRIYSVSATKNGYVKSVRPLNAPWNDIAIAEPCQLIREEAHFTTVEFDGSPSSLVLHRNVGLTDDRGHRSLTAVFHGDNPPILVGESGDDLATLSTVNFRATEYPTPDSMPGKLPFHSAFTYCVELTVDGAEHVRFQRPVPCWIDNFLDFPVGEAVPLGYYDRVSDTWVPARDGRVVRLLDTNSDTIVDSLDADGDGDADDLNEDGSFSDEVAGLSDPAVYLANSTYWRVEIPHFSTADPNWPNVTPRAAIPPNPRAHATAQQPQKADEGKKCGEPVSSNIEPRAQVLEENIAVTGTGLNLHYSSGNTPGYKTKISVPVSGTAVPALLKEIFVRCEVGGRRFEQVLPPQANQKADFLWDGLDFRGNPSSATTAQVSIGFVYPSFYARARREFERSFAEAGIDPTTIPGREDSVIWSRQGVVLHRMDPNSRNFLARGWTLSSLYDLNPSDPDVLHRGDGSSLTRPKLVERFAGTGDYGDSGDGGPARDARFEGIGGVETDPAGNLYICDRDGYRIRKVDRNGIISTFAGNGEADFGSTSEERGDGLSATAAQLYSPTDIEFTRQGEAFIATWEEHIRKVDKLGIISTPAGIDEWVWNGNNPQARGDGGPAVNARLNGPWDLCVDDQDNVYIADYFDRVIRKIDPAGIITYVAGNGLFGDAIEGFRATASPINRPTAVDVDAQGNIYFMEYFSRLMKIDTSGILTHVAGGGIVRDQIQGLHARQITFSAWDFKVHPNGDIYIVDDFRLIRVDPQGIVSVEAGTLGPGPRFERGLAIAQYFEGDLYDVAFDAEGNTFLAEGYHVNKISPWIPKIPGLSPGEIPFPSPEGQTYVFDATGRHRRTHDTLTGQSLLQFGYGTGGKLSTITDRFGNEISITRNAAGVISSITSPDNATTQLTIDARGDLVSVLHPDGSRHEFEYADNGLMTLEVKPGDHRYERTYDPEGRLIEVEDEENGKWTLSQQTEESGDAVSRITAAEGSSTVYRDNTDLSGRFNSTITAPDGSVSLYSRPSVLSASKSAPCGLQLETSYGVDPGFGFLIGKSSSTSLESGLRSTTQSSRSHTDSNGDGSPEIQTDTITRNGKTTTLITDTTTSKRQVTSPSGRTLTESYDPATLLTSKIEVPGIEDYVPHFDSRGRPTGSTQGDRSVSLTYASNGLPSQMRDALDRLTSFTYDSGLRLESLTRADSRSLGFEYTPAGDLRKITGPLGAKHEFSFNDVGLPSTYMSPSEKTYTFTYDTERRPRFMVFPSGRQLEVEYEGARVSRVRTPEGDIQFDYLCSSRIGSISRGPESISYGYDGPLVTSITSTGSLNQVLSTTYDTDLRPSSTTYAGETESILYDVDGQVINLGSFTIGRSPQTGLPSTFSDGILQSQILYNGFGELRDSSTTVSGNSVARFQLTRDKASRIEIKRETIGSTTVEYQYTYDLLDRLLTVTRNGSVVEDYDYDGMGRRTAETNSLRGITGRAFTYNLEDQVLTAGSDTFTYNDDGFMSTRATPSMGYGYTYSSRGELLAVTRTDGTLIQYVTDPLGRRVAKRINGVTTEKYLWASRTGLLAVFDGQDNIIARFEPGAVKLGGTLYYTLTDQVGSLRALVDHSGTIVKEVTRDSFGNVLSDSNPALNAYIGFAGGLYDQDTGLVLFGYRDYLPDIGRWTAKDPLGLSGGDLDVYAYCGQDPVNRSDRIGLLWWVPALIGAELLAEVVLSAADIKATIDTLNDPCATAGEKLSSAGLTAAGVILPFGGFSAAGRGMHVEGIAKHHIFPKAKEFAANFERVGIRVDDFLMEIPEYLHRDLHRGRFMGKGGFWNNQWRNFFDNALTPPDRAEVVGFAQKLLRDMGMENMPLVRH